MVGCVPPVTWTTVWSWRFVRAPMRMWFTSPLTTAPNQTDEPGPISTSPTTTAPSATQTLSASRGALPPQARIRAMSGGMLARATGTPQEGAGGEGAEGGAGGIGRPVERVGAPAGDEGL